jgi:hypothetical protein
MAQLIDLVHAYEKLKKEELQKRALLVLEMIERIITFPPVETITDKDITRVDGYVVELIQDLRRDKQYLFSVRIGKIWNKREQLLQLGKTWHEIQKDYIDEIEYHQEIKWLRDQRRRILNLM